ncbi:hypothetical protein MRX96_058580 [Rhipicephalus microplus]
MATRPGYREEAADTGLEYCQLSLDTRFKQRAAMLNNFPVPAVGIDGKLDQFGIAALRTVVDSAGSLIKPEHVESIDNAQAVRTCTVYPLATRLLRDASMTSWAAMSGSDSPPREPEPPPEWSSSTGSSASPLHAPHQYRFGLHNDLGSFTAKPPKGFNTLLGCFLSPFLAGPVYRIARQTARIPVRGETELLPAKDDGLMEPAPLLLGPAYRRLWTGSLFP